MYLLFSKSKYTEGNNSWYDGYISTMSETDESLCCLPIDIRYWQEGLDNYKNNPLFTVEKNDDQFIIRKK